VATGNDDRAPLLLIAGGQDHTVPETLVDATLKQYRDSNAVTELITFTDRGHSLTIDHGWNQLATEILVWLRQQSLGQ
jgi:esterase/lipase